MGLDQFLYKTPHGKEIIEILKEIKTKELDYNDDEFFEHFKKIDNLLGNSINTWRKDDKIDEKIFSLKIIHYDYDMYIFQEGFEYVYDEDHDWKNVYPELKDNEYYVYYRSY